MRITGGRARGITIKAPNKGEIRPATDYLREAVFSSLGPDIVAEARLLDCFAGTGAYGLEALSRGAAHTTFLEQDRAALKCLQANAEAVTKSLAKDAPESTRVITGDVFARLKTSLNGEQFDLIFADPPYPLWKERGSEILTLLAACLSPTGRLIAEAPGEYQPDPPSGLSLIRRLAKGPRQPSALIFGMPY
ncbi:MAG: RsmD family RNA methyltransferase [Puniceicoccales bacterium]